MSRELSDRLAQSAPDASPELANVSFVPLALDFIFPDGVLPWAPVPDPGTTPTVTPINGTVDVRQNLEIYSYETVFANNLNASLYSSFDMVLLENRGTIWSQDADGSVMLASGGNWEAIVNDGQMIAISGSGSATGFSSGSWGILQNHGNLFAISFESYATGYVSWSPGAWSRNRDQINSGTIEAWSGMDWAVGVSLVNAGEFFNSGTIRATGFSQAVGIEFSTHDAILHNSGTIEAISSASGVSAAILHDWNGNFVLNNSGTIRGEYAFLSQLFYTPNHTVNNTGIMEGAIVFYDGLDTIQNAGLIVGDVFMFDGADVYDGQAGTLVGILDLGHGNDVANGGVGADFIIGGRGNDLINGGGGDDHLDGGFGDDALNGGEGMDIAYFDTAQLGVTINLNTSNPQNTIGAGIDTLISIEGLVGSAFADTLIGNSAINAIYGDAGNDLIFGGAGDDLLDGEGGNDTLRGDAGSDTIFGRDGADLLVGGEGADFLDGGDGADNIFGGAGDDLLTGGVGNDSLRGDDGNDELQGGIGADLLVGGAGIDTIHAGDGNDVVYAGQDNDTVYGGAGDDNLRGEAGDDLIFGGLGSDAILAGAGADLAHGEDGDDRIYAEGGDDQIYGGIGNDLVRGQDGSDLGFGGAGNDLLIGDAGIDTLYGEAGNDKLYGGNDADFLIAGDGNDILYGDAGNDLLEGGTGSDVFLGGTGVDIFAIGVGAATDLDRIKDFDVSSEVVRFVNSGFTSFTEVQAAMAVLGVHTIITLPSGDRVLIDNTQPGQFTAANFEFSLAAEVQVGKQDVSEAGTGAAGLVDTFDFGSIALPAAEATQEAARSHIAIDLTYASEQILADAGNALSDQVDHFDLSHVVDGWHA
jgi:Ca2+-binding RTX toxin-like protein